MKCPNCYETLVMSDRQGVEIDYCPRCRGVWLDKGELDKIIDKAAEVETRPSQSDPFEEHKDRPSHYGKQDPYYGKQDPYNGKHDPYYGKRKKKGFLGDLFDFD